MVPLFMVQVDNATPIILNREKSVTLGILGTLALWRFTKLSPGMGELYAEAASMGSQGLGSWRSRFENDGTHGFQLYAFQCMDSRSSVPSAPHADRAELYWSAKAGISNTRSSMPGSALTKKNPTNGVRDWMIMPKMECFFLGKQRQPCPDLVN
jgi:hypothetical protein